MDRVRKRISLSSDSGRLQDELAVDGRGRVFLVKMLYHHTHSGLHDIWSLHHYITSNWKEYQIAPRNSTTMVIDE